LDVRGHLTAAGAVTTLAGTASMPGSADGVGADARFNRPSGVVVDGAGNVYVADTGNSMIRAIRAGYSRPDFCAARANSLFCSR